MNVLNEIATLCMKSNRSTNTIKKKIGKKEYEYFYEEYATNKYEIWVKCEKPIGVCSLVGKFEVSEDEMKIVSGEKLVKDIFGF